MKIHHTQAIPGGAQMFRVTDGDGFTQDVPAYRGRTAIRRVRFHNPTLGLLKAVPV